MRHFGIIFPRMAQENPQVAVERHRKKDEYVEDVYLSFEIGTRYHKM